MPQDHCLIRCYIHPSIILFVLFFLELLRQDKWVVKWHWWWWGDGFQYRAVVNIIKEVQVCVTICMYMHLICMCQGFLITKFYFLLIYVHNGALVSMWIQNRVVVNVVNKRRRLWQLWNFLVRRQWVGRDRGGLWLLCIKADTQRWPAEGGG